MTKQQLIEQINNSTGLPKPIVERVGEALVIAVVNALPTGEIVELFELGSFEVKEKDVRTGRLPSTEATVALASNRRVLFRASKRLKESLRNQKR